MGEESLHRAKKFCGICYTLHKDSMQVGVSQEARQILRLRGDFANAEAMRAAEEYARDSIGLPGSRDEAGRELLNYCQVDCDYHSPMINNALGDSEGLPSR